MLLILAGMLLTLASLTAIGERRRGGGPAVVVVAAVFFPLAWAAWYRHDQVPGQRRDS